MATLNTLLVNGNSVNGTRNWNTNQDYLNIDETIAGADGSAIIDNTNGNSTQVSSYLLSNTNTDFGKIISLSWRIRRRVSGAQTNQRTLGVRIVTETAGVVLAAADSGGTFTSLGIITNTTFANAGPTAFAYVNTTATKAQWDDARIEFQNSVNKVHGGDVNGMEIDSVELTGTYNSKPTVALNTADAFDFGDDPTPTLEFTGSDAEGDDLEYQVQIFSSLQSDVDKYVESNQDADTDM